MWESAHPNMWNFIRAMFNTCRVIPSSPFPILGWAHCLYNLTIQVRVRLRKGWLVIHLVTLGTKKHPPSVSEREECKDEFRGGGRIVNLFQCGDETAKLTWTSGHSNIWRILRPNYWHTIPPSNTSTGKTHPLCADPAQKVGKYLKRA